jgi:hypothetical protein
MPMPNSTIAFLGRLLGRGQSLYWRAGSVSTVSSGPCLSMRSNLFVAASLCVLALLLRLPWYFMDVIDIDEGTFVLMGQSLANGRLPYTEVWDNKPPLGFVFFALVQLLVPNSLAFVRFAGTFLVAASAFLVFRLSLRHSSTMPSVVSAVLTVVAISVLIPSGQSVMMEHVALVPLLGALALTIRARDGVWSCIAVGALLGTAALVRLNLAIPAIVVVLGIAPLRKQIRSKLASGFWVAVGGVLVLLANYVPYALSGHSSLYLSSVFAVPLAYSASNLGFSDTIRTMLGLAFPSWNLLAGKAAGSIRFLLWIGGTVGLIALLLTSRTKDRAIAAIWMLVYCAAVSFSTFLGGHAWDHYLIQAAPFFAIGVASLLTIARLPRAVITALLIAILLFGAVSVWPKYAELAHTWKSAASLYAGDVFDLVAHLELSRKGDETYFFSDDILPYWLLNRPPVIPIAAFPSNIFQVDAIVRPLYGRDYDTERVIGELFAARPTIVVTTESFERWAFPLSPTFTDNLKAHYTMVDRLLGRSIYRRK